MTYLPLDINPFPSGQLHSMLCGWPDFYIYHFR